MSEHLESFIQSFIRREKRDRILFLLSKRDDPKRWFQAKLGICYSGSNSHDMRFATHLSRSQTSPPKLEELLWQKGAPPTCYILMAYGSEDEQSGIALRQAIGQTKGATLISCIPGKLAYLNGGIEGAYYLFER